MPARRRLDGSWFFATAMLLVATTVARADGMTVVGAMPRSIGRAGTGTVGDDGAGATIANPAALARRETKRVQLGLVVDDDAIAFRSRTEGSTESRTQSSPALLPVVAAEAAIRGFVVGIGVMTTAVTSRGLRDPNELPADKLADRFDYRYAGISGGMRRDTLALAVARRLGDTIAVGASFAASRVSVSERRRIWAGFGGREDVGDPIGDVEVEMIGDDNFVPSAVLGVMIAPEDSPLELGASIGWSDSIGASGSLAAAGTSGGPTALADASPTAAIGLRQPWTIRGGVRYLGERLVVEVGGEYYRFDDRASTATWQVDGIRVRDPSTLVVPLLPVPSRISARSHMAMRGSIDVEVLESFLWITGGYAYARGGTTLDRLSPTFGDLGGHTFALGVEAYAGGVTLTLGYSRTMSTMHSVDEPALLLDNPFNAGDQRSAAGSYDGSIDQLGLSLDLELDAP